MNVELLKEYLAHEMSVWGPRKDEDEIKSFLNTSLDFYWTNSERRTLQTMKDANLRTKIEPGDVMDMTPEKFIEKAQDAFLQGAKEVLGALGEAMVDCLKGPLPVYDNGADGLPPVYMDAPAASLPEDGPDEDGEDKDGDFSDGFWDVARELQTKQRLGEDEVDRQKLLEVAREFSREVINKINSGNATEGIGLLVVAWGLQQFRYGGKSSQVTGTVKAEEDGSQGETRFQGRFLGIWADEAEINEPLALFRSAALYDEVKPHLEAALGGVDVVGLRVDVWASAWNSEEVDPKPHLSLVHGWEDFTANIQRDTPDDLK